MTRLKRRRVRITKAIRFYLKVVSNGEWRSIQAIINHLDYSSRGRRSYNSLTPNSLGQYMRFIPEAERQELFMGNSRSTQYRILNGEEEE